jgi:hypothetical protein
MNVVYLGAEMKVSANHSDDPVLREEVPHKILHGEVGGYRLRALRATGND